MLKVQAYGRISSPIQQTVDGSGVQCCITKLECLQNDQHIGMISVLFKDKLAKKALQIKLETPDMIFVTGDLILANEPPQITYVQCTDFTVVADVDLENEQNRNFNMLKNGEDIQTEGTEKPF